MNLGRLMFDIPLTARTHRLRVRFWSRVEPVGDCWVWTGARSTGGHGAIDVRLEAGRHHLIGTHRLSWILTYGTIPDGLWVLHQCDNPPCVRPSHLYLGTRVDNVRDAVERQGMNQGVRSRTARLNAESVLWIRENAAHLTRREMGRRLGVDPSTVTAVVAGRTWSHVRPVA